MADERSAAPDGTSEPDWDERLVVPLWWVAPALAIAGLAGAEVHGGVSGVRSWLPYVVSAVVVLAILGLLSLPRVRVRDGVLSAGGAHLPLTGVRSVQPLAAQPAARLAGRDADPAAHVLYRPWTRGAVVVVLREPSPVPYWLVSTRRPERLAAVLGQRSGSWPQFTSE